MYFGQDGDIQPDLDSRLLGSPLSLTLFHWLMLRGVPEKQIRLLKLDEYSIGGCGSFLWKVFSALLDIWARYARIGQLWQDEIPGLRAAYALFGSVCITKQTPGVVIENNGVLQ